MSRLGIHYRRQFFAETQQTLPHAAQQPGLPRGLVGREVANAEMLNALLQFGTDESVKFFVHDDVDVQILSRTLEQKLPKGKKAVVSRFQGIDRWMEQSKYKVLWEPQPPSASLAWMRSRLRCERVALAGVTHALCSSIAVLAMRELAAAPGRHFDRLICTSESVAHTARMLIEHWSDVMGKSCDPNRIGLETIPLGIDCERHAPATPQQRADARKRLAIPDQANVVLFVGRLSHHAKSNPLPLYRACQAAATRSGNPTYLVLAGWYASTQVEAAFESEARRVAPDVHLLQVDGMDPQWRDSIWAVADVFVSLADSIQETFGLTVVEAMSRRLPVVASDWNGYRESIVDGETGLLVPTTMVAGAGERGLLALHEGRISYDQFLAVVGQSVCVSTEAACDAIESLFASPDRRNQIAEAGCRAIRQHYAWPCIIARYERLWRAQRDLMHLQPHSITRFPTNAPSCRTFRSTVPTLREMFDRYPTQWISPSDHLVEGTTLLGDTETLLQSPISGHSEAWRSDEESCQQLIRAFQQGPTAIHDVASNNDSPGNDENQQSNYDERIDTIAWALKYDLLKTADSTAASTVRSARLTTHPQDDITFTTTCMGRLEHLKQTLPRLVAQTGCQVIVTDYSCPDRAGEWIRQHFSPSQVRVVEVCNRDHFHRSEAKNAAIAAAQTPWVCVIDADVRIADDFADQIRRRLVPNRFLRCMSIHEGVGGTFVAEREALEHVGLHDLVFKNWGEQDADLLDALLFIGKQVAGYPEELISHISHEDEQRTRHHRIGDLRRSHLVNRLYRAAKWDLARLTGEIPEFASRRRMYDQIAAQVDEAAQANTSATITVPVGSGHWDRLSARGTRALTYRVDIDAAKPT